MDEEIRSKLYEDWQYQKSQVTQEAFNVVSALEEWLGDTHSKNKHLFERLKLSHKRFLEAERKEQILHETFFSKELYNTPSPEQNGGIRPCEECGQPTMHDLVLRTPADACPKCRQPKRLDNPPQL